MKNLNSAVELCLPYNWATTFNEAVKDGADDSQNHPHHHRPSAVAAQ